jgi:hypothetical protein
MSLQRLIDDGPGPVDGPMVWKTNAVTISVNGQMFEDIKAFQEFDRAIMAAAEREMAELVEDMRTGPRLGPGRHEYNKIMQPVWRRERLQRELARMGRPAGPFRRTRNGRQTGSPPF